MKAARVLKTALVAAAFALTVLTVFTARVGILGVADDDNEESAPAPPTPRRAHITTRTRRALITTDASAGADAAAESCDGRRVYMHPLPPEFNTDLLESCDAYELWGNYCDHAVNAGLGPRTHPRSKSWFRTDVHMLDLIFHNRMLRYRCLTADADAADAFYLPYYGGLDAVRYLLGPDVNRSGEHGAALADWLGRHAPEAWRRHGGADHFVVLGRPAWDLSRALLRQRRDGGGWGTSFLELPALVNVTALVAESRAWPWQEQAVPYPTSFHPSESRSLAAWIARVRRSRRTRLFSFAGGGGTGGAPNIRRSIRTECAAAATSASAENGTTGAAAACELVDCEKARCEHEPGIVTRAMLRSQFCLQPPGDTPTRRATFDAVIAGCIPVFFEPQAAYTQYTWHLPAQAQQWSVMIPKDEVVLGGLSITETLRSIGPEEVRRIRRNVIALIPRVMYRHPRGADPAQFGGVGDAFDVAVEAVLRRVRRVKELGVADFSRV